MSEEITTETAQSETEAKQSNMSVSEFTSRRLGQMTPAVEAKEEEAQEAPVESTEEVQAEPEVAEQASESQETDDVLSKLDLDEMSEDDLKELSEKLGSRAVARFGELTAKRKAAEEQLQKLQSEVNKKNPLETQEVAENPYESIDSLEGLQQKAQEINEVIEWAEDTLFNADGYGPEDVVTEVEGKELTKADVRKSLLNARKSRDRFLPAQLETIQNRSNALKLKSAFDEQAKQELPWMAGEDNDTRKSYEAMVSDNRFQKLADAADPEVAAQLNYIVAHAANSIYGRKAVANSPTSPKLNPTKTGATSASSPEKTTGKSAKALKDLGQRFKNSGTKSDFITLRTLQLKNR
jgi:hypothetical protein|tara:strand:+ start:1614 stop:2669 length:1056 start_codon:yes stop_codon:yes gene_type:complete